MTMFESLKASLLEAIEIENGNREIVEIKNPNLPASTYVVDTSRKNNEEENTRNFFAKSIDKHSKSE